MSHCPIWGLSFSNLCNGAKVLSLLPKDCLEVGLGRKQKGFSYLRVVGMWFQPNRVGSGEWALETLPNSRLE